MALRMHPSVRLCNLLGLVKIFLLYVAYLDLDLRCFGFVAGDGLSCSRLRILFLLFGLTYV